ncbi:hypothetical protein LTS10_010974 [Elasticomyces elasticus]|nr:hypothetical protein LTS10_010974 [Elasticomyces elasticus]
MTQCKVLSDPDTVWPPSCPNIGASYLFAVLFALTLIGHVVQMIWTKKWYSWVIVTSSALQVATYTIRTISIQQPASDTLYSVWFILMLIAPIFTNAFAYMVMGRMVYNFTAKASVGGIKAWRFGLIFVLLDVLAFLVQAGGASIASGSDKAIKTVMLGLHIYMGGIGFQQLCIFAFLALAVRFHLNLPAQPVSAERRLAFRLLYVEYAVLTLITMRIGFRLAEYSNGLKSTIPQHEVYQYVLDSLPMLAALVLYNAVHPGFIMRGQEANLPARKERKALKKVGQQPLGRAAGTYAMMDKQDFRGSDVESGLIPPARTGAYHDYSRDASPARL